MLAAQVARHVVVLGNIARARRYVACGGASESHDDTSVRCAVVLPMLREQRLAADTVAHFRALLQRGDRIYVVTTAREDRASSSTTADVAATLADGDRVVHLHLDDVRGRKGDQINHAVDAIARETPAATRHRTLIVIYDADSRPPCDSLRQFATAASRHPHVDVFHQSARFEVRDYSVGTIRHALADAHALRANRFVLGYELPRLLSRSPTAGRLRRVAAGITYGHVTGHGLALRLPAVQARPMPSRMAMEDMAYSFGLAVDRVAVQPIASLDCADVTASSAEQLRQNERWFTGPGRGLRYRAATPDGARRELVSLSALLICAEWLSCVAALPMTARLARRPRTRRLAKAFLALYAAELIAVDATLGAPTGRASRLAAYPVANTLFGLAAWTSIAKRLLRAPLADKTERA